MSQEETNYFIEEQNKLFMDTRTILVFGEVTQKLAQKVCYQLLLLKHAGDAPITIFVNSQGGHVEAGDTIHDMIRFIGIPVNMVGTGWVASAGVTIYLAAEKARRFSLPNTRYMIHQPSGGARGMATDIAIEADEIVKMRARINKLISDATGQPLERVTQDTDRNHWMDHQEAAAYGIVGRTIQSISEINS